MNTVNNTRAFDKTENGTSIIPPGQETNKDLFLKMLVAQMANQDPFNPQDPSQYVTQLAQFSQLEQSMALNDAMDYLIGVNNGILVNSAMSTASSLIGKNVELSEVAEDGEITKVSGEVKSTFIKDGIVYLDVKLDATGEVKSYRYESLVRVNGNTSSDNSNKPETEEKPEIEDENSK